DCGGGAGIVCSAAALGRLGPLRARRPFFSVTPGIRPTGAAAQDQQRVATIAEAAALGAGLIVLGRAVTSASDAAAALEAARAECVAASRPVEAGPHPR